MEVLSKSVLDSGKKGQPIAGVCLIKNYTKEKTKAGKPYFLGQLQSGSTIGFKVWSEPKAFNKLLVEDYSNVPTYITGSFDEWNGTVSIIIDDVQAVEGYTPDQFFEVKYNASVYLDSVKGILGANVSEKGMTLANSLLFNNEELVKRFSEEFAAMTHHDNCKTGLLAHTQKLLCLASWVAGTYSKLLSDVVDGVLVPSQDRKDLLFLGTLFHDIGKTREMEFGVYQPNSQVSHRIFGAELLIEHKAEIIALYGEKWFYNFVAVLVQHHGQYGDPCRDLMAYIVHNIDNLDSIFTGLVQEMESGLVLDSTGSKIRYRIGTEKTSLSL